MTFTGSLLATLRDVAPICVIIAGFQVFVLRRRIARLAHVIWGFAFVIAGLALFLLGLEMALFPLGEAMAVQLTAAPAAGWSDYSLTYLFAFSMGTATAIAEPALIAVAQKAQDVSGGAIQAWGLRWAVAVGVGCGVAVGALRIVLGIPLAYFILTGYFIVIVQTYFTPKQIVPLAYDSGGVATSTVTVPLIAALGLGLASRVPGRDPLVDGFGLIAFAALFPVMTVMGYAQLATWWTAKKREGK